MYNLNWSIKELTPQKIGAFCELYAKMALTSYGMTVYSPLVDDHGIDFVAEGEKGFFKFQVKGIRKENTTYVFAKEDYFDINDDNLYLILIVLTDGKEPDMFIIPTKAWRQNYNCYVYRDYKGKKSDAEYGINISKKNWNEIAQYDFDSMVKNIV